jgi:hypothetical protein
MSLRSWNQTVASPKDQIHPKILSKPLAYVVEKPSASKKILPYKIQPRSWVRIRIETQRDFMMLFTNPWILLEYQNLLDRHHLRYHDELQATWLICEGGQEELTVVLKSFGPVMRSKLLTFLINLRILSHEETDAETTRLTTACRRCSWRRRAGDDNRRMKGEDGPLKRSECHCAN